MAICPMCAGGGARHVADAVCRLCDGLPACQCSGSDALVQRDNERREQRNPHAIKKMGLIVDFDAGVVTGFTGITARLDEVNANSVLFKETTTHRYRPDHRFGWCDRDYLSDAARSRSIL